MKNEEKTTNAKKVVQRLIDTHTTISTMESCTSGMIASMITDTEGASAIFPGGYVTYQNQTKILAGVDERVIDQYGVYSAECAAAMAKAVQENLHTDIAVGITGTTGNVDPNNADSIRGEVHFCILMNGNVNEYEFHADVAAMDRHEIKKLYAERVFSELIKLIQECNG